MPRTRLAAALIVACATAGLVAQAPVFRTGVQRIRLDVTVVGADGTPVRDLSPEDFVVTIDGQPRSVTSAEFIDLSSGASRTAKTGASSNGISTNPPEAVGRLTILAIDTSSLHEGQELALIDSMSKYLDSMGPTDRTGLLVLPNPSAKGRHVELTTNVAEVREVLSRTHAELGANGGAPPYGSISASSRSAPALSDTQQDTRQSRAEALGIVRNELTSLAKTLQNVEGTKTLILMAGSLPGGLDALPDTADFAAEAARARLTLYVVHRYEPLTADDGLYELTGMTGGTAFDATGNGTAAFQRIARETSASYLLGIEPVANTPFEKPLKITVKVNRPGLTVRSPKQVVPPAKPPVSRSSRDLLADALSQPRPYTELPLALASFSARGADKAKLKTVIVAEMPDASGEVVWGFQARRDNKIVADAFEKSAALDAGGGQSRVVTTSALLPAGDYALTFAAIDGTGRRGSLPHPLAVSLHHAGAVTFSDVFVGAAADGHFRPRLSFTPGDRQIVAFVEIYDDTSRQATSEFLLVDDAGTVLSRASSRPADQADKRMVSAAIPIPESVPASCRVVAEIHAGTASARTEHAIRVAAPAAR